VGDALDRLRHRGPDDRGELHDGPAFLGMRRLAVIDPAGGHQPVLVLELWLREFTEGGTPGAGAIYAGALA